jgi:site-specific recombinase XerD
MARHKLGVPPSALQLEQLDAPLVLEFLEHLQKERGNGARTRNARLTAIKSFMHFVEYRLPSPLEQVKRVLGIPAQKTGVRLVDHLTVDLRVQGKGRKDRILTLWEAVAESVRAWLAVRGEWRVPELFLNARAKEMTRAGFEYLLRKYALTATGGCPSLRGKRVSPHVLRHTCALIILQATGDIRKVALWLGHESIQTTMF